MSTAATFVPDAESPTSWSWCRRFPRKNPWVNGCRELAGRGTRGTRGRWHGVERVAPTRSSEAPAVRRRKVGGLLTRWLDSAGARTVLQARQPRFRADGCRLWTSQRSVTHSSVHQAPDPPDDDDEGLGACDVGRPHRVTKLETNTDDDLKVGLRRSPTLRSPSDHTRLSLGDDDKGRWSWSFCIDQVVDVPVGYAETGSMCRELQTRHRRPKSRCGGGFWKKSSHFLTWNSGVLLRGFVS